MSKKLVSIITVCYNSEKTIKKTIESVINQTYKNIEYILIDGGSTDGTMQIIKTYQKKYDFIKYVSEKDEGIYDAMNKGIKMASGDLIGILNSDDYYELNAIETMVNAMTRDKYQILYGYMNIFKNGIKEQTVMYYHWALNFNMINHPTCFVTKDVYNDYFLYDTAYKSCADYDFMIKIFKEKSVKFIPVDSIIANFNYGGMSQRIQSHIECTKMMKKQGIIDKKTYNNQMIKNIF